MREIGRVVRLQIQTSSLKVGPPRDRRYDPTAIASVNALTGDPDGVRVTSKAGEILDVHHARHPDSKNRNGINPISIGFTSHYDLIRAEHGEFVIDGMAGENILVASDRRIMLDDIAGGLVIQGEDGRVVSLGSLSVAHPCVEFSRFVMGDQDADARTVAPVLRFLGDGMRGYYARIDSPGDAEIRVGDRVFALPDRMEEGVR